MKSKPIQNLNEKSQFLKNKRKKTKLECPCIRFVLSILKNKVQSTRNSTNSVTGTHLPIDSDKNMKPDSTLKNTKKSRVIRLPKIGCIIPFLMALFNDLSNKGAMPMDACDITKAVNIISNAKMELDRGKAWNGKIEIAENLHLKLYKSGLVLYHKH